MSTTSVFPQPTSSEPSCMALVDTVATSPKPLEESLNRQRQNAVCVDTTLLP